MRQIWINIRRDIYFENIGRQSSRDLIKGILHWGHLVAEGPLSPIELSNYLHYYFYTRGPIGLKLVHFSIYLYVY